jgi:iron complex outermembrane receptor protein
LGVFDAALEASYGNFNEYTVEGVVNVPVTQNSAFRVAAFVREHDSRLNNITPDSSVLGLDIPTSEDEGVGVAEAGDDFGIRAAYLIKPVNRVTFTLTGDYIQQRGTGFTGVNFANPLGNGIDPDTITRPRDVFGRGFTPDENTDHWGIKGQLDYDGRGFNVEYIGSYRDLVYDYEFVTPAGPFFEGALDTLQPFGPVFDNFSRVRFITDSESIIQELRLFSDADKRFTWAVGGFYFSEAQRTFLGTTGDRNPFFSGVEFNQTTDTTSFSFYGDATFSITEKLRLTGGLRYTRDEKERFGVNARYQFITGGAGFAPIGIGNGTEGFEFAALDRTIFDPDTDGNGTLSDAEVLSFYFNGIAQFGDRDGLDDIFGDLAILPGGAPAEGRPQCANFAVSAPGCPVDGVEPFFDEGLGGLISFGVLGGNSIALQNGRLLNDFVDWRARLEYDITKDNLVYALISTGNRSGGFNDNIPGTQGLGVANPSTSAPAIFDVDTLAPTFGPERLRLFEIGSKNEFDVGKVSVKLNLSAFYYDYNNLQQTTLTSVAQILDFEDIEIPPDVIADGGLGGQIVAFTFNAANAEIFGTQLETGLRLPGKVNFNSTLLWLPGARIVDSQEIQDARFQADVDPVNAVNRSIEGNRLIRTPRIQFNASLSKAVTTSYGQFDGIVSIGYRSSQNMTIFNGIDFNNPDDPDPRLDDRVGGYVTLDLGAGFSLGSSGKYRLEFYGSNVTNVQRPQAIIITQFDNTRFFNTPRLYGVRVRARF